jgi:hypothetical protein
MTNGEPKQDHVYSAFQAFDEAEWMEWLSAFLADNPRPPFVRTNNDPPPSVLIRVFEALEPKSSLAFNRALFRQFEETAIIHKNAKRFYTLLHVMSCTLPGQAKPLLRRRLREGVFRRLNFEEQNLHSLLLVACSKFDVDEELVKWVQRSARNSKDFDYLLLCQWVLSTVENDQAFYFNERLLPFMNDFDRRAETTRQLFSIADRLGYERFYDWFREQYKSLQAKWPVQWQLFVRTLRERLLSDTALPEIAAMDPDAVLLYAALRVSQDRIPLETVLTIARLHESLGTELTVKKLFKLWKDFQTRKIPWNYMSAKENFMSKAQNQGTLFYQKDPGSPPPLQFRVDLERETENVLIEVRKQYESYVVPLVQRRADQVHRPAQKA